MRLVLTTSGALELLDFKLLFLLWFSRKMSLLGHRYMQESLNHCLPPSMYCDHVHRGPITASRSLMLPGFPRLAGEELESCCSLNKELEQTWLVKGGR